MAANSVNNDTAKEISKETDRFYGQLETKYSFSITRNDISQKLAVKDLFRELKALKKETVKAQSETSLKEKNEIQKGWLTSYGVSVFNKGRRPAKLAGYFTPTRRLLWK